jgi:hypothetical protein
MPALARAPKRPAAPTPWLEKIEHAPMQPKSGEPVTITARVRPEVMAVILEYQLVEPGAYIELSDSAFTRNWVSVPMQLDGATPDPRTFRVELPGQLQKHRRLIRYRLVATAAGKKLRAPDPQDESPNYAYFVYDGIPGWKGVINPRGNGSGDSDVMVFPPEAMRRVRAYHLIARKSSVENATWREPTRGKEYKYTGTLVAEGDVFDHIRFRARGGVWRYAMGKNMWKFDLGNRGLKAADDFGQPYPARWSKINLRACIQQGDYGQRGEQGMFESVGFQLFNLVGVPAPETHWLQLRIIDEPEENPANQYRGDFWGLYLAIENEDGHFLKAHSLPNGNLYKMDMGTGELKHHGTGAVTNRSDLDEFMFTYSRSNPAEHWWRTNLDLTNYYSYRAICECIHHYDIGAGKNYDYFRYPGSGIWLVIPWDIDLTWADNMFGNGEDPFKRLVLNRPALRLEYQNRLREIRDLLFNPEQMGQMLDEYAAVIWDPSGAPSMVEADRRKWDYHPVMAMGGGAWMGGGMGGGMGGKAGQGLFYEASRTHDFRGMVQRMKGYVKSRGAWVDRALLDDPDLPATPSIRFSGGPGFSSENLHFRLSSGGDAKGLKAIKWRLAQITPAKTAPADGGRRHYEITAAWESAELTELGQEIAIPKGTAAMGHTYRVRARVKDAAGRWSHWSEPAEFIAGK